MSISLLLYRLAQVLTDRTESKHRKNDFFWNSIYNNTSSDTF